MTALLVTCLTTPWVVHTFIRPATYLTREATRALKHGRAVDDMFVLGGASLTGVLVVADDQPLRNEVPTLHLSDFMNVVRQSGIETYQPLVTPTPPTVPFALVEGPNLLPANPLTSCTLSRQML